jgi:hypothetical protein
MQTSKRETLNLSRKLLKLFSFYAYSNLKIMRHLFRIDWKKFRFDHEAVSFI